MIQIIKPFLKCVVDLQLWSKKEKVIYHWGRFIFWMTKWRQATRLTNKVRCALSFSSTLPDILNCCFALNLRAMVPSPENYPGKFFDNFMLMDVFCCLLNQVQVAGLISWSVNGVVQLNLPEDWGLKLLVSVSSTQQPMAFSLILCYFAYFIFIIPL